MITLKAVKRWVNSSGQKRKRYRTFKGEINWREKTRAHVVKRLEAERDAWLADPNNDE